MIKMHNAICQEVLHISKPVAKHLGKVGESVETKHEWTLSK